MLIGTKSRPEVEIVDVVAKNCHFRVFLTSIKIIGLRFPIWPSIRSAIINIAYFRSSPLEREFIQGVPWIFSKGPLFTLDSWQYMYVHYIPYTKSLKSGTG